MKLQSVELNVTRVFQSRFTFRGLFTTARIKGDMATSSNLPWTVVIPHPDIPRLRPQRQLSNLGNVLMVRALSHMSLHRPDRSQGLGKLLICPAVMTGFNSI